MGETSGPAERLRVAAARAEFLDGCDVAAPDVPDDVAASWRRSRSAGVAADRYRVEYHDDIDFDSRLARCARPVLARLCLDMSDVPVSIALTDARARIIDRRDCSAAVGRVLDRVDFNPGFGFAETSVGTNGIGTVFEAGAPVSVIGPAHFNEALVPFACTGAPVVDPMTGRLAGVLDVSLLAESWSPLIHALVKSAAADIGRALLADRSQAQQALFDAYLRADTRSQHAVLAVGDSVMVNQRAQRLLSSADQLVLQQHARDLMTRRNIGSDVVGLPDGRSVRVRPTRVLSGSDTSGVVLVVSNHQPERQSPAPAWAAPGGTAWDRAHAQIRDALRTRTTLLVTGARGSGRSHLILQSFRRLWPAADSLVLDAGQLRLPAITETGPGPTLLLLRNLDQASATGAAAVAELLARLDQEPQGWVIAGTTTKPIASQTLLGCFGQSVPVPTLQQRAADIPRLLSELLDELAAGRAVRISPAAARSLHGYHWPGQVAQLREALAQALARRPVGEIGVEDLPGYCRTSGNRQLTTIEVAERDAIIAALVQRNGNRAQAAADLGIARSSMYRKLRQYAIVDV